MGKEGRKEVRMEEVTKVGRREGVWKRKEERRKGRKRKQRVMKKKECAVQYLVWCE